MKRCENCQGEMKGSGERFCCLECSYQGRRRRTAAIRCENPACGREFYPRNRRRRFCSRECYRAAPDNSKHRSGATSKACLGCKSLFLPIHCNHLYCSPACRTEAADNARNVVPLTCGHCGVFKLVESKRRRYCSRACYNAARRERRSKVLADAEALRPYRPPPSDCIHHFICGDTRWLQDEEGDCAVTEGTCSKCGETARFVDREKGMMRRPSVAAKRPSWERPSLNEIPHYA